MIETGLRILLIWSFEEGLIEYLFIIDLKRRSCWQLPGKMQARKLRSKGPPLGSCCKATSFFHPPINHGQVSMSWKFKIFANVYFRLASQTWNVFLIAISQKLKLIYKINLNQHLTCTVIPVTSFIRHLYMSRHDHCT